MRGLHPRSHEGAVSAKSRKWLIPKRARAQGLGSVLGLGLSDLGIRGLGLKGPGPADGTAEVLPRRYPEIALSALE